MGVPGPGGPCSEILYDRGPEFGPDADWEAMGPAMAPALEDRYLEFWNLVFMQDELSAVRSKEDFDIVGSLPRKNIDTGMGLERVAYLLQGKKNMYEIDVMFPVIERAQELSGRRYGADAGDDVRLRVVADHVRSSLMLIGDGVTPGNEGRGYVLRRLMRRAIRSMRLLGVEDRVLPELLPVSRDRMGETYTELHRDWERISTVAYAEEDAFRATLRAGTQIFDLAAGDAKKAGQHRAQRGARLLAARHLRLPDRPDPRDGLRAGSSVDEEGFRRLMGQQRDRAKADAKAKKTKHGDATAYREVAEGLGERVEFTGYDEVVSEGTVRGIVSGGGSVTTAHAGDEVELVLDRTPFYAEGGGQLADQGVIELGNGARVEVLDVQSPITGLIVHQVRVLDGEVSVGEAAQSLVDVERRRSISRAHTATHMVHKAFREALGDTATQAGSENAPGRFRFDFSATGSVPTSVLADVEARVNDLVLADLPVEAEIMTQKEAVGLRRDGPLRREVRRPGARGLGRRLGPRALRRHPHRPLGPARRRQAARGVLHRLRRPSGRGARRGRRLPLPGARARAGGPAQRGAQGAPRGAARAGVRPRRAAALGGEGDRVRSASPSCWPRPVSSPASAEDVGEVAFVGHRADGADAGDVRRLALDVRGRLAHDRPGVVAIVGSANGKPSVVVAVNDAARSRGISANALVKAAATALGGRGGGKDDVAQGGGADTSKVDQALADVRAELARS